MWADWLTSWEFWAILGIVLGIAELLTGTYVLLAFGATGLALAVLLLVAPGLLGWPVLLILYGVIGVALSVIARRVFRQDTVPDINDYKQDGNRGMW